MLPARGPLPGMQYVYKSGRLAGDKTGRRAESKPDSTAFEVGVNARDAIAELKFCLVCGRDRDLQHAHIIPQSDDGER